MKRLHTSFAFSVVVASLTVMPAASAQSLDSPVTRLRPIGAPSAVDQYLSSDSSSRFRETGYQQNAFTQPGAVRQTVLLQQMDAPPLPGTMQLPGTSAPPPNTNPANGGAIALPPSTAPRDLPANPGNFAPVPMNQAGSVSSSGDLAPVPTPQLNDGFATIDNCNCISAPSNYMASSGSFGCTPVSYQAPAGYIAQPAQIAAPAVLPTRPRGAGVPAGALISFGQETYPVQVGQGLFGQPVAYVPGQRIRNWIRYVFP